MESDNNAFNKTHRHNVSNNNMNNNINDDNPPAVNPNSRQKRCCPSSRQHCPHRHCCSCRCHHYCCCYFHHDCHCTADCNDNYSTEQQRRRKRNLLSGGEFSCDDNVVAEGKNQQEHMADIINGNDHKNSHDNNGGALDDNDFSDVSEEDDVTNGYTDTKRHETRRRVNHQPPFGGSNTGISGSQGYSHPPSREAMSKETSPSPPPTYGSWQRNPQGTEQDEGPFPATTAARAGAAFTKEETRRRRRRSSVMGSAHVRRKTSQWSLLNNVTKNNNLNSYLQPGTITPGSNNTNNSGNVSTTPTTSSTRYLMPTVGCHCTNCLRVFGNKGSYNARKKSRTKQQQQLHQQLQLLLWQQQQIQHQQELNKQQQQQLHQPQLNRSFGVIDTANSTGLPSRQISEDSAVSVLTPESFVPETPDVTISSLQSPELSNTDESEAGKDLATQTPRQASQTVLSARLPVSVNGRISISVENGDTSPKPEIIYGLIHLNESVSLPCSSLSSRNESIQNSSTIHYPVDPCVQNSEVNNDGTMKKSFGTSVNENKCSLDVQSSASVTCTVTPDSKTLGSASSSNQLMLSSQPNSAELSLVDSLTSLVSTTTVTTTSPKSRNSPGLTTRVIYTQPAASMFPIEEVRRRQDPRSEEDSHFSDDEVDSPSNRGKRKPIAETAFDSSTVSLPRASESLSTSHDIDDVKVHSSATKDATPTPDFHSSTSSHLEVSSVVDTNSSEVLQTHHVTVGVDPMKRVEKLIGSSCAPEKSPRTSSRDEGVFDTQNIFHQQNPTTRSSDSIKENRDKTENKFFRGIKIEPLRDSENERCAIAMPSSNHSDKVIYTKCFKKDYVVPKISPKNSIGLFDLPLSRENILPLYRKTLSESNVFAKDHTNVEIRKLIANKAKLSSEAQSNSPQPLILGGKTFLSKGGQLGKHRSVVNVRYCEVNPFLWDIAPRRGSQEARQLKAGDNITHTEGSQKVGASMRVTGQDFSAHKSAVSEQQQRHTVTPAGTISEENSRRQSKSGLTITTKGVCTQQKSSMTSSQSNISYTGFEDFDLGGTMQPMDIQNAIMKYSGVMTKFVDQLKSMETDSFAKAPNLLDHMNDMMKRAWSLPTYGHELGYSLCKVLKHNGGLDILLENCTSDNSNLKFSSAKVLEQCLTTENRGYVVEKGLENVVNVACDCTQENRTIDQSRVGTGILEHLFKHSEGTCSDIIKLGGLEAVVRECRKTDVETLRHCAGALANLSLYGGSENQQAMVQRKVAIWLFPLAFHHDDNIKYYACLAIAALVANTEIEAQVLKGDTLSLIEPFVNSHLPEEFANSTVAHRHGQSRDWLERLVPVLSSKREEARNLAAFHFCMEAGIKKNQGNLEIFQEIDAIEPLKQVASSPNAIASKYAAHALRLMGEEVPHKLSQQVPLWQANDVQEWVKQIGFGLYADAFVTSRVDGDLLLQIGEENLQYDIGIANGILRQRFLRELRQLRQIADYSSRDTTGLNAFMTQLGQEYAEYTYKMLLCGASKSTLRFLSDEQLMTECGIYNSIHRQRIKEGIFDESSSLQDPNQLDKNLDVFISYRRSNGSQLASLLKVHMQLKGFSVFIDVERLEAGKFDNNLLSSIRQARNFLLVLTPNALDRCTGDIECKDWVHKEIVAALESNCNIIPIIDNFQWPEADQLPEDMRAVCYFNGVRWIHDYQDACVDKLERFMRGEGSLRGEPPGSLGRYQSSSVLTQPGTPSPLPRAQHIYQRTASTESGKGSSCSDKDYLGKD